jgi:hypothetical protein
MASIDVSFHRSRPDESTGAFTGLDEECRLRILEFLSLEERDESASLVSKCFRDDCRHPSLLPRGRTAVVCITDRSGIDYDVWSRFYETVSRMAQATTADGRRRFDHFSRLKIVNAHLVPPWRSRTPWRDRIVIPQIESLDLSLLDYSFTARPCWNRGYSFFASILALPNLQHVCLSNWLEDNTIWGAAPVPFLDHRLKKLAWRGLILASEEFHLRRCDALNDLSMDHGCFLLSPDEEEGEKRIFLGVRRVLERVSIVNARLVKLSRERPGFADGSMPIPQPILIEFARNAPKLKWFRSDLNHDNMTMLEGERPDVTFVRVQNSVSCYPS